MRRSLKSTVLLAWSTKALAVDTAKMVESIILDKSCASGQRSLTQIEKAIIA
jgi:hypothetical protein